MFVSRSSQRSPERLVDREGRPLSSVVTVHRECPVHGWGPHGVYGRPPSRVRVVCKRCSSDAVTRRHQKVRATLIAESGGCCAVCGYDRTPINLHFHHVDPQLKQFNLASSTGKGIAALRAEASKCVLVCANCHGEIEAGLIPSPPPQARWRAAAAGSTVDPVMETMR
jgi:hypothetical protein